MTYKLLVVDDDKDTVANIKAVLLQEGYGVETAFDGKEALEKVKAHNPDVIILDLIMPKLNGFDVLKEIREKYTDKWRPVIIVSAKTELESVKSAYDLEADHYLTKPFTIEDLLRGIRIMISLIPARLT
jgi:DNA-binding response OmpR family regulator